MSPDEKDERLTQLLLKNAPPARDPLFRVKVLERRERQHFRRNVLHLTGSVAALAVAAGVATGGGTYETMRFLILGIAAAVMVGVYVPLLMRLWRASVRG